MNQSTIENYVGVLKRAAPVIGLKPTLTQARDYLSSLRQKGDGYAHLTVTAVGLERVFLVDRGANVFTIQHQLGHRHLATTLRYLHPTAAQAARQYHACVPRYGS